jgi:hypothetical protein
MPAAAAAAAAAAAVLLPAPPPVLLLRRLLLPLLLRRLHAFIEWTLIASGISSISAVSAEVTRTSNGRTHNGMPAAAGQEWRLVVVVVRERTAFGRSAVSAEVTRTSKGRTHVGMPAAARQEGEKVVVAVMVVGGGVWYEISECDAS